MRREDRMYQTEGKEHAEAEVRVLAGKPGKKAYATPWTCSVAFTEKQWLICTLWITLCRSGHITIKILA